MVNLHQIVAYLPIEVLIHIGGQGCRVHGIGRGTAGTPHDQAPALLRCLRQDIGGKQCRRNRRRQSKRRSPADKLPSGNFILLKQFQQN